MLFTVGVESPSDEHSAFGLIVPALCTQDYACFSGADTVEEIVPQVIDAIHTMFELMLEDGFDITMVKDKGFLHYKQQADFAYCDSWLLVDVDITGYFGKKQRVNVVLPQYILDRIDQRVIQNPSYKDRSHFLMIASQHELHAPSL